MQADDIFQGLRSLNKFEIDFDGAVTSKRRGEDLETAVSKKARLSKPEQFSEKKYSGPPLDMGR